jgi:hypothetical protein
MPAYVPGSASLAVCLFHQRICFSPNSREWYRYCRHWVPSVEGPSVVFFSWPTSSGCVCFQKAVLGICRRVVLMLITCLYQISVLWVRLMLLSRYDHRRIFIGKKLYLFEKTIGALYIVLVELAQVVLKLGIARSCRLLSAYGNRSSFGSCVCIFKFLERQMIDKVRKLSSHEQKTLSSETRRIGLV